uniref:Serpentine Receptor, class Z n=1 Tax=Caenorhabditis tropicalis TaxID=1561998 RepID=A0A1I7UIN7_9PELO
MANGSVIIIMGCAFAIYIITQVFYLLISFLASQRLLLYFIPTKEKQISKFLVTVYNKIVYIYIGFAIKEAIGLFLFLTHSPQESTIFMIYYTSTYIFLNGFLILSALFYIPITISVKKLVDLTSQNIKPHKYVFFQTLTILVFKSVSIPFLLMILYFNIERTDQLYFVLVFAIISDMVFVPFIVQVSYLGCNKRNVSLLIHNFKLSKFLRVLLGINQEVRPQ